MRTQKALKNIIVSIMSAIILGVGSLLIRKLVLDNFAVEYLGYTSLFNNIFTYLALAEGGIGVIINYRLYEAIAKQDEKETAILMAIFGQVYRWIGLFVAVCGGVILLLLPWIVKIPPEDALSVYAIYFIQLLTILSTFFLAYRKNLIIAYQKQYYVTNINTVMKVVEMLLKVVSITVWKSFILYILTAFFCNVAGNVVAYFHAGKEYPYIKQKICEQKELNKEIKKRDLLVDIKNIFPKQIAMTVYSGTDSILISMLLGIQAVGMYDNYMMLVNNVSAITSKLIDPICASVGNLTHEATKERINYFFDTFDLMLFYVANFCGVCFMLLFQPAVAVMFGKQYMLPYGFAFFLSVNTYIGIRNTAISTFRNTVGTYNIDRNYMIAAAVVNIAISIIFTRVLGITGIILGTIAGHLLIFFGAYRVVNSYFLKRSILKILLQEFGYTSILAVSFALSYLITLNMPISWVGIIERLAVCMVLPNVVAIVCTFKSIGFAGILEYVKKTFEIAKTFLQRGK